MPDYTTPERDRIALLTFAVQKDCTSPGSPVGYLGGRATLARIGELAEGFRKAGAPIIHLVRLYRPDGSNVDACRRRSVEEGLRVLMPGSCGAELVPEVNPAPETRLDCAELLAGRPQELASREWALYRPRWGAFYRTGLEDHLQSLGVTTLAVCGCNFSTAIRATIYEASERDFRVVVVPDAISGATQEDLADLARIGVYLMNTECCVSWLSTPPRPLAA
ncbi:MAG: isochorismatase family cysteine hydrolase [Kiloniellales bacterium]|jgi:nicotinamidase-related amidase|nr:isochorismatase family cysteine hydrolase [Kiloniellales bacterium]